jgi:signal transduction histidine kinase
MAYPEVLEAPPARSRRAALRSVPAGLGRLLARTPGSVRTKLLVAFLGIAAILVVVSALGLRVLGQANARVERLDALQVRAARYQEIESHAGDLQQTLNGRAAGASNLTPYTGGTKLPASGRLWALADLQVADTLSQVELAADEPLFGFVPPPADERKLRRIRADYRTVARALARVTRLDAHPVAGTDARRYVSAARLAGDDLDVLAQDLAFKARAETQALVQANGSGYVASRDLFIGVSAGSVLLALALGLLLSWSLIGPIRRTEARLAEIAAGDFSGRIEVPNRDEIGSLAANVNRMNDELGRLYQEVETVSRHKSEFLATMSHELRTPLNAIIGFSEVLQEQMFGTLNERQLSYVEDVLAAGRHLLSLINDVLDLAKIEAGRMDLDLRPVSVGDVLGSGMTMHGERAGRAGIALGLSVEPEEIVLTADERRVRQVVFNLLSNAIAFTPRDGRIDVSARLRDGMVEVAVADTGPGIAPDDLERIFEEFDQGSGAGAEGGTGLGLPLSRKFVELHGGRLWVESSVGAGSTFRFTLPVTQEEAQQWQTS